MRAHNNRSRLNIFVDETGEVGIVGSPSGLYGISLVVHDHSVDISEQLHELDANYSLIGYTGMPHMGDLVHGQGDYEGMDMPERRKIFTTLYRFSLKTDIKFHTIIIDKAHMADTKTLYTKIKAELQGFVLTHKGYLDRFDKIVVYYDGGQKILSKILDETFGSYPGYERRKHFDRTEKRLFQVADMLTTIDRVAYKYLNGIRFSNSEKEFFSERNIKAVIKETKKHRFR